MAIKTTLELIEEVDAAISATLDAQQMGMGDKLLLRARLKDLYEIRKDLLGQYRAENNSGGMAINTGILNRG
jgi:hypothetical protein